MFIAMYVHHTRRVDYLQPLNIEILLFMIAATFAVAYKTEYINKHRFTSYGLILLALVVAIVFDSSPSAQFGLFLGYLGLNIVLDYKKEKEEEKVQDSNINSFEDLLKRGNLPDDDREVPNWMKIKNEQFDDVDFSHNMADDIVVLSSDEFNEFVSLLVKGNNEGMLFTYITTLNEAELQRFYRYLEGIKLNESMETSSAKEQFQSAMQKVDLDEIIDTQKERATLELPLSINYAKTMYHKSLAFKDHISQGYYDYEAEDDFKVIEGHLVKTIWGEMKYIPDHFEQVLDHFKDFYDENNAKHLKFAEHLVSRFGHLILELDVLLQSSQEGRKNSLSWFAENLVKERELDYTKLYFSHPLIFSLTHVFKGINEKDEFVYMAHLIRATELLFEFYPVNDEACHYAMTEMMKSVAHKEIEVEIANRFITFFEHLPRFYEKMDYWKIYHLKELINYTLSNDKPQDNKVFDEKGAKHKLILLNYLVDMEDLYYEGTDMAKQKRRYNLFLSEYIKLFETFAIQSDLVNAGLWDHPVTIDTSWDRYDAVIKDKSAGTIGWMSPVTADIFDMSVEIPIVFEKINGEYLSVGIPLELVELKR